MGKYSLHTIEMVRNGGINVGGRKQHTNFFMLDYFDVLFCKALQGQSENYLDFFTIKDTFDNEKNYKVSYKSLSLYCKQEEADSNPFLVNNENHQLSATPFLGMIQISLCKECFEAKMNEDVDSFLALCEERIYDEVEQAEQREKTAGKYSIISCKQLYRSLTTGDFCLAFRTNSIDLIYKIAFYLNDSQSYVGDGIKVITYTNIGIECQLTKNEEYCTFDDTIVELNKNISFELSFSADREFEAELRKYGSLKGNGIDAVKGLFGQYEYLIYITMKEFRDIYPILCEKKMGITYALKREANCASGEGENIVQLAQIISNPNIRNINERVLVECHEMEPSGRDRIDEKKKRTQIIDRNNKLYERIIKIEDYKKFFWEEHRTFEDLMRGMRELYKTFSAVGLEKDAYIDWLIYHEDMNTLCHCIDVWAEKYKSVNENEKKEYRLSLLMNWRINLQAINQYTRLVENVNYQTYQTPVYEIQTQIDTAKTMVAYREAMDCYLRLGGNTKEDIVIPIIFPDLSKDAVEVTSLFLEEDLKNKIKGRMLVCTVPSFEYFGRLYDLLPWIMHESSHSRRIIDRAERNEFIVTCLLERIFTDTLAAIFINRSNKLFIHDPAYLGRKLNKCIISEIKTHKIKKEEMKAANYEQIVNVVDGVIAELFYDTEEMRSNIKASYQNAFRKDVSAFFVDTFRKEMLNVDIAVLEQMNDGQNLLESAEKCVKELLDKYNEKLLENRNDIADIKTELFRKADFQNPISAFEEKEKELIKTLLCRKVTEVEVMQYIYSVKQIYRVLDTVKSIDREDQWYIKLHGDRSENDEFWGRVYDKFQAGLQENPEKLYADPDAKYVMRSLGLFDEKKTFCKSMADIFKQINKKHVSKIKSRMSTVYREACADLLMAFTMKMTSFGYCRQVLQTLCDAYLPQMEYSYENINFERFRWVVATLLVIEQGKSFSEAGFEKDYVKVEGLVLLEQGKIYCEYTLKCIEERVLDNLELNENRKDKIIELLTIVNAELNYNLETEMVGYQDTLLCALLHEGEADLDDKPDELDKLKEIWQEFSDLKDDLIPIKYNIRRLEIFCKGLTCIVQKGVVEISRSHLIHMVKLSEIIQSSDIKMPEYLLEPKRNVGEFYNQPETVYTLTSNDKLENTIDFIQNYYYRNRFSVVEREKEQYD